MKIMQVQHQQKVGTTRLQREADKRQTVKALTVLAGTFAAGFASICSAFVFADQYGDPSGLLVGLGLVLWTAGAVPLFVMKLNRWMEQQQFSSPTGRFRVRLAFLEATEVPDKRGPRQLSNRAQAAGDVDPHSRVRRSTNCLV